MLAYTFTGPYIGRTLGKDYSFYRIKSEDGRNYLNNLADGHLVKSDGVIKELGEIQKVLNGQKAKHVFGGSAALILTVTPTETEFENDLTEENYGKVPTMEVVKLLTDWRDFLISKGK